MVGVLKICQCLFFEGSDSDVSVYLAHAPLNAQQHMYPLYIALDTFPTSSVLPLSQHLIGSIQAINEILPPLWR